MSDGRLVAIAGEGAAHLDRIGRADVINFPATRFFVVDAQPADEQPARLEVEGSNGARFWIKLSADELGTLGAALLAAAKGGRS